MVRILMLFAVGVAAHAGQADFADLERRARAGERLSVAFFGASLTWGANASDPQRTSYRAVVARRLEDAYPAAHWRFHDAAIGGTGSQLAVFRLDRDVLAHRPDLVFLDFTANDGIDSADTETLASYESLIRRLCAAGVVVVPVLLPFRWDVESRPLGDLLRRDAHLAIATAYGLPAGDAVLLARQRLAAKATTAAALWPFDGVHPGDEGYVVFADAAWGAFRLGCEQHALAKPPAAALHGSTYLTQRRLRLGDAPTLPAGWRRAPPNPVGAYFDMVMSRWLDREVVADAATAAPLRLRVRGAMIMLYGESTRTSCRYRVRLDGAVIMRRIKTATGRQDIDHFDAAEFATGLGGNAWLAHVVATGLDATRDHELVVEPLPGDTGGARELRLESICVAGGEARVELLSAP